MKREVSDMGQLIRLTIPGMPIPKGRPRLSKWGTYTPKRTKDYESKVERCWDEQYGNVMPLDGPVSVTMEFLFEPPKSARKAEKIAMLENLIPCMNTSDLDNLVKSVSDALNGRAYGDDRQIVELRASKEWAEVACVVVSVQGVE